MYEKTIRNLASILARSQTSPQWNKLLSEIEAVWPVDRYRDVGVCVGCSGGADSVALALAPAHLRILDRSPSTPPRGFFELIHVNHGLRGDESDQDESFVRKLAVRLEARCSVVRLSGIAKDEATLRDARDRAFSELAHASGARYVAVAHSLDDVAETMLMQLIRGSGPAGLASIPAFRPLGSDVVLVRPMLHCPRQMIREGLRSIGEEWREDSSNQNTDYTRNWLRHGIIPVLEKRFPGASTRIAKTAFAQSQWRQTMEQLATNWIASRVKQTGVALIMQVDSQTSVSILIESMRQLWLKRSWPQQDMTANHWSKLARSLHEPSETRYELPGNIHVESDRVTVRVTRVERDN